MNTLTMIGASPSERGLPTGYHAARVSSGRRTDLPSPHSKEVVHEFGADRPTVRRLHGVVDLDSQRRAVPRRRHAPAFSLNFHGIKRRCVGWHLLPYGYLNGHAAVPWSANAVLVAAVGCLAFGRYAAATILASLAAVFALTLWLNPHVPGTPLSAYPWFASMVVLAVGADLARRSRGRTVEAPVQVEIPGTQARMGSGPSEAGPARRFQDLGPLFGPLPRRVLPSGGSHAAATPVLRRPRFQHLRAARPDHRV